MEQILIFNSLLERYFDWAKNFMFRKILYFVPIWPPKFKMAVNVEKSSEKLLLLKNYGADFNIH